MALDFDALREQNIRQNTAKLAELDIDDLKASLFATPLISTRVIKGFKSREAKTRSQPGRACKLAPPSRDLMEPRTASKGGRWPCLTGCNFVTSRSHLFAKHLETEHKLPFDTKNLAPLGLGVCHACGTVFASIRGEAKHQRSCRAEHKPLCEVAGGIFPRTGYVWWYGEQRWFEGIVSKSDDKEFFHVEYPESIYDYQSFSVECYHNVTFSNPFDKTLSPARSPAATPRILSQSSISSVLTACDCEDLDCLDEPFSLTTTESQTCVTSSVKSGSTVTQSPCPPAGVTAPTVAQTGGAIIIRADGDCCFHLAGVLGELCRDEKAVCTGYAACSDESLAAARTQILGNFGRFRARLRGPNDTTEDIENKVFTSFGESSKEIRTRASGEAKGQQRWGLASDLSLYTMFEDIRVVAINADGILRTTSDADLLKACVTCELPSESQKLRVVCAILSGKHWDLGAVFSPEARAVFEFGADWDQARTLILNFLRSRAPEKRGGKHLPYGEPWKPVSLPPVISTENKTPTVSQATLPCGSLSQLTIPCGSLSEPTVCVSASCFSTVTLEAPPVRKPLYIDYRRWHNGEPEWHVRFNDTIEGVWLKLSELSTHTEMLRAWEVKNFGDDCVVGTDGCIIYPSPRLQSTQSNMTTTTSIGTERRRRRRTNSQQCADNVTRSSHGSVEREHSRRRSEKEHKIATVTATATQERTDTLPPFVPQSTPVFMWGARHAADFIADIDRAYELIVKWRKNVFKLPSGSEAKHFVRSLTRLYTGFAESSALESIAFKGAAVMAPLLLQQPCGKPNYTANRKHLARRLALWDDGNIDELLREGQTIQERLPFSTRAASDSSLSKRFAAMVFNNNLRGAISLVTNKGKGRVLQLDEKTIETMREKHPEAAPACADVLLSGPLPPDVHPSLFASIDGDVIKKCCLRTKGAAGISQQEDNLWHRMVTGFKETSSTLCTAIASVTRRLATEFVDPNGIACLLANRGIAVDKCPGLRPIGVGEVLRRVIGKAIMTVTAPDVQKAVGPLQLCAGQPAGVEAAIHSMSNFLDSDETDGILLIDADNAFNRVNREVALWNIQYTCPVMKVVLINFYRSPSRIFMLGEGNFFELLSREGTTQGCPLAMAMYALALIPMLREVQSSCNQVWYADDATGCDTIARLHEWYTLLRCRGANYGFFIKPENCVLVVKPQRIAEARRLFKDTGIEITSDGAKDDGTEAHTEGARHLGAAVGSTAFKNVFVENKVRGWVDSIHQLSEFAKSEPHAAFSVFTHCLQSRWTFLSRSVPGLSSLFQPLEDAIRLRFLPALLRREVSNHERDILGLPARFGGLGIFNPVSDCGNAYRNSKFLSEPLVDLVMRQEDDFQPNDLKTEMNGLRNQLQLDLEHMHKSEYNRLLAESNPSMKSCLTIAHEKGASSWVTAIPCYDHDTVLNKGEFVDAVYIRYGWTLPNLPTNCVCGASFDVQHALDCMIGGYRTIQHNEVRDVMAKVMKEAGFTAVETEPPLQPLTGEQFERKSANTNDEARSDIKCVGFYSRMRAAYFDVKVVSPYAKTYSQMPIASLFRMAEKSKMREYAERIKNVEHGDFNPLVFTTAGGMAPQCQVVVKKLAAVLSEKLGISRSVVTGWLRCRLSFALLRTTLLCVRGTRARRGVQQSDSNIELAVSAARIDY